MKTDNGERKNIVHLAAAKAVVAKKVVIVISIAAAALALAMILGTFSCRNPLQDIIDRAITPRYALIVIKQGTVELASGSGSYDFGAVQVGTSKEVGFIVENGGENTLTLSGDPLVAIGGTDAADFAVTAMPGTTLEPGATATFSMTFTPSSEAVKSSQIMIACNDSTNAVYTVSLTGTGTAEPLPEISVTRNSVVLASGSTFNFGAAVKNTAKEYSFVINNTGQGNLMLTGTDKVAISGANAADFSVTVPPSSPVPAGGSSTFTLRLEAAVSGVKTAAITIATNDADEGIYVIQLTAAVTDTAGPEIEVYQGSTNIANGGSYNFGNVLFDGNGGVTSSNISFKIENMGTAVLTGISVTILSGDFQDFDLISIPATSMEIDNYTTFSIRFDPLSAGNKSTIVQIFSNDPDESPYNITITGSANPDINVKQNTTNLPDGTGTYNFGSVYMDGDDGWKSGDVEFTIENVGCSDLAITDANVTAGDFADFDLSNFTPASIPATGTNYTSFTINFDPLAFGTRTATVTITNSDPDEGDYTLTVTGTGSAPEVPTVITYPATNITGGYALSGGNVTSDGGSPVTSKGVYISSEHENPGPGDGMTNNGSGSGEYLSNLYELEIGTTYYVRAYATNSVGTAYGQQIQFTTDSVPTVTTTAVSSIHTTYATGGGNVTYDGGDTVTARGVCWSESENPDIGDSKTVDGNSTGVFSSSITGLTVGTTYYVRAYATNNVGTAYGNQVSFTAVYAVGDSGFGGIIFSISGTYPDQHGYVAASSDQSTYAYWGCNGTNISGATGTAVGTGSTNTTAIDAACTTPGIAADLCANLSLNGYDDWFLPSKDELNLMFTNLKQNGIGSFVSTYYWSSSQFSSGFAWRQYFYDGLQEYKSKNSYFYVRAARAF